MSRVAAVDCGTNSIRLLVSDLDAGAKSDLERRLEIVRLGQGVDRTGRLAPEALERTFAACDDFAAVCTDLDVERIRFCATSAARDASNGAEFAAGVVERFGVEPEVLSGDEEAALSFAGAMRERAGDEVALVLDIGGGSTELIRGRGAEADAAQSLDIGSGRLTERHLHSDPPTENEVAAAASDAESALDTAHVDLSGLDVVVGVAGTITTVAAHVLELPGYDSERIHDARLPVTDVRASCAALLAATVAQRREMPFMHPGRAEVIGGGAVVLSAVLDRAGVDELVVSEHDILDGIVWSMAESD